MKFPGDNKITFTESAIRELLKEHAPTIFGDPSARITNIKTTSYPPGLEMTFTTDIDPTAEPAPPPPPRRLDRAPRDTTEAATPRPIGDVDDDHLF